MKKLYLATICFLPPAFALLLPAVFVGGVPFPVAAFPYLIGYFWIGLVALLVDLWRSRLSQDKKVLWTVLNLFFGLVTLPIYWFLFVRKEPLQPPQTTAGSGAPGRV
jgi:hypothetical protein